MMVNDRLIERIESEGRGPGFSQLRNWLYWDFIQELLKICDDTDDRAPSIRQLKRELDDTETLRILKGKILFGEYGRTSTERNGRSHSIFKNERSSSWVPPLTTHIAASNTIQQNFSLPRRWPAIARLGTSLSHTMNSGSPSPATLSWILRI